MTKKIGLIAGSGQFPLLFAQAARKKGLQIHAAAYRDEADPELSQYVESIQWLYLGQVSKLIKFLRSQGISQAVMLGAIRKTRMFTNVKPDIKAITMVAGMRHTHDDALLRQFAKFLEKEGIQIQASTLLLPELLATAGIWTRRKPSRSEKLDIELGYRIAKEIGRLDIGQCVVVGGGSVLAVEAMEGTDIAISRGGQLGNGKAVVVKVCKPNQDTRFDIPAVGLGTIEAMRDANVKALAIEAGKAVVFDRDVMIERANENKMTILALDVDDFSPTRRQTCR
jgi:hypothetical protein